MEEKKLTGYPSIDKPWLKYYSSDLIEGTLPNCTMYEYLYSNNIEYQDSIAINYFGNRISYRRLFAEIDRTANALFGLGIKKGDVVPVVTLSCVDSVILLYALNKIGAVFSFLNVMASANELSTLFSENESEYVFTMDLFGDKVLQAAKSAKVKTVICFSLDDWMPLATKIGYQFKKRKFSFTFLDSDMVCRWENFLKLNGKIQTDKNSTACCCIGHTGGTTGVPKAVRLSDNSINAVVWQYINTFPHNRGDSFFSIIIPFVLYGMIINIHMPLCLGLELVIVPKFDAKQWQNYFKKYKPVHMCSIPAYTSSMLENAKLVKMDLSFLKTVGIGGEGMNIGLERKLNDFFFSHGSEAKLLKGYGMTEVCATAASEYPYARKEGSVGIPFVKNEFMIVNIDNAEEQSYGQVGEICMQCASYMIGYKDLPDDSILKKHKDGSWWIHTGDLGYIDKDGFIFLEGRLKRMIMVLHDGAAYKIFPTNTEEVINKHISVKESCVVKKEYGYNIGLVAFVVLNKAMNENEKITNELKELCKNTLSPYQIPEEYYLINEFPRTAAGKVDYRALEEMAKEKER